MTSSSNDTDRETLIAEARRWPRGDGPTPSAAPGDLIQRLVDALEELPGHDERVKAEALDDAADAHEEQYGQRLTRFTLSTPTSRWLRARADVIRIGRES